MTALAIRKAAAQAFASGGYDGVTMRQIAADAGVDVALLHHYFGTKRALFEAALVRRDVAHAQADVAIPHTPGEGERVVRAFLDRWDHAAGGDSMPGLLRAAATDRQAAAIVDQIVEAVIAPAAASVDAARSMPKLRGELVAAQLVGLAWMRYVLRVEPLASASSRIIAKAFGPSLDATIGGSDYPKITRAR